MVTFSLPGEGDSATSSTATPRSRPPLPFAKRAYAASPYGGLPKRLGTPHSSSSRAPLLRDDQTPSSLSKSSLVSARNIFRASTISDSPPSASFAPSLPASTPKRVFAPGATPEPSRFRGSTAQATPRGVAAAKDTELFNMRISSPPKELTGETLARKVPKDWDPKGSIYADQFLADYCPAGLDDEQRRQFFCILDLRRLKYAADEIFTRKDWKLNVTNFAKEFEKSRSIILLRYGLYEFKNVKPSKDVLKRWRREHGLPDPEEEEEEEPTPSKAMSSKKRKADPEHGSVFAKRKTAERDTGDEAGVAAVTSSASTPSKNKRKASMSEQEDAQPSKKPSSQTSSLFQKIANKSLSSGSASTAPETSATPKTNPFAAAKPASSLARSVFNNNVPKTGTETPSSSIFGQQSGAGSVKHNAPAADVATDAATDDSGSPEAGQSDGPSPAASGADNASQAGASLFAPKPAVNSGFGAAEASGNSTRESTPGSSLFERVSKDVNGEPQRAHDKDDASSTPKPSFGAFDQTWNPSTTPMKFAPSTSTSQSQSQSIFGTNASSSMFGPKSTTTSLFGAPAASSAASQNKAPSPSDSETGTPKPAAASEKEEKTQSSASSLFGAKASAFGSTSQSSSESAKTAETKPASTLFGSANKASETPASSAPATSLFGAKEPSSSQNSTLFGAKRTEDTEKPGSSASKPLFGAVTNGNSTAASTSSESGSSLFGTKPAEPGKMFGSNSTAPTTSLFRTAKSTTDTPATSSNIFGAAKPAGETASESAPASKPVFSFGSASSGGDKSSGTNAFANKPLFDTPKSPPATNASTMFDGSPMKQDEASPAKKPFPGTNSGGSAAPALSFGTNQPINSTNIFGNTSSTPAANPPSVSFGGGNAGATNGGSGTANFSFGSTASPGSSFNNPFASGGGGDNAQSTPSFNFGASTRPSTGASTFQFGGASNNTAAAGNSFSFGANQASTTPQTSFGGTSTGGGAASFSFGGGASQPATPMFGGAQSAPQGFAANLQPPAGGASTNGTNTPFSLGGNSSLATTPAAGGTPEPSANEAKTTAGNDEEEGEKHEQINLADAVDENEDNLHEVRAKILKFVPADSEDGDAKAKAKSPWSTQGVGKLRLLKHKETGLVRLLLRAEPRGNIAMNRALMSSQEYKADKKYVKLMTSNEKGDGLETWMIQVKTPELATDLAAALEKNKKAEEE